MSALGYELVTVVDAENPVVGDIRVGGLRFVRHTDRKDAIAQACAVELRWWLGEWSFDTSRGTAWLEVLGQRVTVPTIRAFLKRQLEQSVAGVDEVVSMSISIDGATGYCQVSDVAIRAEGELVTVDGTFTRSTRA